MATDGTLFVDANVVANAIGFTADTVRDMAVRGDIPSIKIGGRRAVSSWTKSSRR